MVAIIRPVVCQEEEFIFLHLPTGCDSGALVGMVYMVAIARSFGVVRSLNRQKTKVLTRTKALISHAVFERIEADAECVSLLRHTSAGTLVNLLPAAVLATPRVSKMVKCSIPVYNADGSLFACVSEQRLARLQSAGLVSREIGRAHV